MLFTELGRSVWEKTVAEVLSTQDLGRISFFPIWTSRPVNNIYIYIFYTPKGIRSLIG